MHWSRGRKTIRGTVPSQQCPCIDNKSEDNLPEARPSSVLTGSLRSWNDAWVLGDADALRGHGNTSTNATTLNITTDFPCSSRKSSDPECEDMSSGLDSTCPNWVNGDKLHSSSVTRRMTPRSQSYCNNEMRSTPIKMLCSFQNTMQIIVLRIYASWTKSSPSLEWPPSEMPATMDISFISSLSQWIVNREKLSGILEEASDSSFSLEGQINSQFLGSSAVFIQCIVHKFGAWFHSALSKSH